MIRVMIVEDQKLVRSLLESYIQNEDGYQLAVSIPGAAEAPILCDTEDIDLVLMDVQTEHRENGLAAAEKIHKAHPGIKIVVVTSLIDHEILKRAKAAGANSLWYKDGDERTLMQVVRSTVQGAHIFPDMPPSVKIGMTMSSDFTPAEMRVLRLLVRGLSYGSPRRFVWSPRPLNIMSSICCKRPGWKTSCSLPLPPVRQSWW